MHTCRRNLLLSLCIGAALVLNYGCSKTDGNTQPGAVANLPVDSGASGKASPNSIDSIIGVYYGICACFGNTVSNGTMTYFSYNGPDTLLVTNSGVNTFFIHSNHLRGDESFVFDSTGPMYGFRTNPYTRSVLEFYSVKDSLQYRFSYRLSDEGTECAFFGRK